MQIRGLRRVAPRPRILFAPLILLVLACMLTLAGGARAASEAEPSQLKVSYLVRLVQDDRPDIEVTVSGLPVGKTTTTLKFVTIGSALGAIPDLKPIFKVTGAFSSSGSPLEWGWDDGSLVHPGDQRRRAGRHHVRAGALADDQGRDGDAAVVRRRSHRCAGQGGR